jgi:tetratricopeptide (TPR) repeat protein
VADPALASEAHATLAKLDMIEGDRAGAWRHMEESRKDDAATGERSGARLNLMALMLIDAGRIEEAETALDDALLLNGRYGAEAANTQRAYAVLERARGRAGEAYLRYRAAHEIDARAGESRKVALDLEGMARLSVEGGRLDEAIGLYERSYSVLVNGGDPKAAGAALDGIIGILKARGDGERALRYERLKGGDAPDGGGAKR